MQVAAAPGGVRPAGRGLRDPESGGSKAGGCAGLCPQIPPCPPLHLLVARGRAWPLTPRARVI